MRSVLLILAVTIAGLFFSIFPSKEGAPVTPRAQDAARTSSPAVNVALAALPYLAPDVPVKSDAEDTYRWHRVVHVVDGDTLSIELDGKAVTLRLIGLDTPETVDPRKPVQCFGKEASDEAKRLLTSTSVRLEYDDSQGAYDKYGRTLAYLYLEDGRLFNMYMIAEGYGHEYTYDTPYRYQMEFKAAEETVRSERRGLWAGDTCSTSSIDMIYHISPSQPTEEALVSTFSPTRAYSCETNTYNCSDFSSHAEAQYVFEYCGSSANDIHRLDSDKDGSVCESLP